MELWNAQKEDEVVCLIGSLNLTVFSNMHEKDH